MNLSWMQHALANSVSDNQGQDELERTSNEVKKPSEKAKGKVLRIMIRSHEQDKVNVNLPLSFGLSVLKKGSKNFSVNNSAMDQVDFDDLQRMIDEGIVGEIVNIESHEGDTVRIVVD